MDFFIHRVGRTGRNQLAGTAITLYDPSDEQAIQAIEDLGVKFQPKEIKNGEIVATYDRNRRQKREKSRDELDPTLIGLVKKKKKKSSLATRRKFSGLLIRKTKRNERSNVVSRDRSARKNKKFQYLI